MERKNDSDDHKLNGMFDECAFGVNLSYKQCKEFVRTCNNCSAQGRKLNSLHTACRNDLFTLHFVLISDCRLIYYDLYIEYTWDLQKSTTYIHIYPTLKESERK